MASSGFDDVPDGQWPLILSNIISATLIRLATDGASRLSEGGTWIVSGVFKDNWPDVMLAMSKQGLGVEIMLAEGEWVAASLRRVNAAPA
jgi:ribosomal protein L11 methylase PrmA